MTSYTQGQVDDALAYMRGEQPAAPETKPVAMPVLRRRPNNLSAFVVLLCCIAFWGFAIWCSVNGWGLSFLLGFCLVTALMVLIGRWPWKKKSKL